MTIRLELPELSQELKPKIMVFGVGGAGGNAVKNMLDSGLEGVEFVIANTDAQALEQNTAERKIQMGISVTQGLGAGSRPDVGQAAAREAMPEILENLHGAHMVFVTSGMGGGTGTGASPVIAAAAREKDILTIGVVTKPFQFEGSRRMRIAEEGVAELSQHVDTLLVIPNQNLFRIANEKTTFADAFAMADRVLHSGVASITDLMVKPGLINLDFADVRAVMDEMGKAMMGTGEANGEKRSLEAAQAAISNPLLDEVSMKGARGVLINITGGLDMTLYEVDEAANHIRSEVDDDCNIIVGSTFDPELDGVMRVSVVATGIGIERTGAQRPWEGSESDPAVSRKVCSIHSMSPGTRGARTQGADSQIAETKVEEGARVALPPRKPISLGRVERSADRCMAEGHPKEEAPRPQEDDEKISLPSSAFTLDTDSSRTHEYDAEHGTDLIFNIPSKAETDVKDSGNSGSEVPEISQASESSEKIVDSALQDAVVARSPIVAVQKPQRGAFWNFWFGGSRKAKRKMHPASDSPSFNEASESTNLGSSAEGEEDQLQIPAFLRRQAN